MSHSVKVTLIADQVITLQGYEVNVHDIQSVVLNGTGCIIGFALWDDKELRVFKEGKMLEYEGLGLKVCANPII